MFFIKEVFVRLKSIITGKGKARLTKSHGKCHLFDPVNVLGNLGHLLPVPPLLVVHEGQLGLQLALALLPLHAHLHRDNFGVCEADAFRGMISQKVKWL